jgi:ElaB/YqjD/DUF883 family membrane-anchored ribosome-binding protein
MAAVVAIAALSAMDDIVEAINEIVDEAADLLRRMGEHTKNARKSTKDKHDLRQARKQRDAGGENGDIRRIRWKKKAGDPSMKKHPKP